jgi:hypothetical protein
MEEADHFLQAEEQEKRSKWIFECQKMAQNAINLASQATRALTIRDWSYQDCKEFLDDLEREFKKVNKELDIHPPMDCEPRVKRKMADCRLRLEAARFEAEKVVTRLLRDHEAWGQVSREGRPKEKAPDTRAEPRSRRKADNPAEKALPVRFENLRLERNDAGAGGPEEDRPRSSKGIREGRHATSTPTGSDREQRLKEGPEEISGIRGAHLPPPAPRREVSPRRSSSRRCILAPRNPQRTSMTATRREIGGGRLKGDPALPGREGQMSGTAGTGGRGAERRARKTESLPAPAGQPSQGQADPGHHRGRKGIPTRRGT